MVKDEWESSDQYFLWLSPGEGQKSDFEFGQDKTPGQNPNIADKIEVPGNPVQKIDNTSNIGQDTNIAWTVNELKQYLDKRNFPSPEYIQNDTHCICKFNTLKTEATGNNAQYAKHAAAKEMLELIKTQSVESHAKAIIDDRLAKINRGNWRMEITENVVGELKNLTDKLRIPCPQYTESAVSGEFGFECSLGSYNTRVRPYFIYQKKLTN